MNRWERMGVLSLVLFPLAGCGDRLILQTNTFRTPKLREVRRLAVVDFAGPYGQAVADMVTINFMRAGYTVVERDQLRDVIREILVGRQGMMDLSDEEKAKLFGKILNADVIVTGDRFGNPDDGVVRLLPHLRDLFGHFFQIIRSVRRADAQHHLNTWRQQRDGF